MKANVTLLLGCLFLLSGNIVAQRISYGPTVGLLFDNPTGSVLLDSIQVTLQGDNDHQPYLGGYVSYELTKTFKLTSGLNYYNSYKSAIVYSTGKEGFERLIHSTSAGNRSVEVPLLLETKVPVWKGKGSIFFLSGISPHIRLTRQGLPYHTSKFISQAMSEALYSFKTVMKPVVWKYSLGVGANIWRLRLEARWQYDLANSATNPYRVWGNSYAFNSKNNTIRFGLGYNLNWKKKN
ncbi:hypothetical protein DXT99_20335 [Pontibacter diazotrophicus]|uniref:Outer membrane protein beta-barrel domain-containing protein n=1 Tax=Pontibacter diazotrophicus TaxID=1400979 RepID=A0A3D8L7I4_9BACT|nr:hypothetical protein [Pontibacter diazotrophicus]RDV13369.1 hypothetical protein DXT99_20335 [Pontibacter diazotrophicus]